MIRWLGNKLGVRSRVTAGSHPSSHTGWWSALSDGGAPVRITESNADTLSTVWACVTGISADVAKLPLHMYKRLDGKAGGGGRERAKGHPAYRVAMRPNPEMTAFSFWEVELRHALSWGNGYAEIERDASGGPVAMWPIHPSRCTLMRDRNDRLFYRVVNDQGGPTDLRAEDVFHLHGTSEDGLLGKSPVRCAMESLSGAAAAERFGRRFFENFGMPGTILSHPEKLSETARRNLRESWREMYGGPENAGGVAVLEEGLTATKISFPPEEAQFLETKQFNVPEVCRWFRYPPHKAGDLSRATFSNIEQQDLAYLGETLLPWLVRIEQEADRKLLREEELDEYYFEHLADAALRADFKSRMDGYAIAKMNGWLNADEIRAKENLNPLPNGEGKVYTVPVNQQTTEQLLKGKPDPAAPPSPSDPSTDPTAPDPAAPPPADEKKAASPKAFPAAVAQRIIQANRSGFEAITRGILRVEADKLQRAITRGGTAGALAWAEGFYTDAHVEHVRSAVAPIVAAITESLAGVCDMAAPGVDAGLLCEDLARAHVAASLAEVRGITTAAGAACGGDWDKSDGRAARDAQAAVARLAAAIERTWVME